MLTSPVRGAHYWESPPVKLKLKAGEARYRDAGFRVPRGEAFGGFARPPGP